MYRLLYTRRAVKDIESLEPAMKRRIGKKLLSYVEDPPRHAEKITDKELGSYRFESATTGLYSTWKVKTSLSSGSGIGERSIEGDFPRVPCLVFCRFRCALVEIQRGRTRSSRQLSPNKEMLARDLRGQ